MTGFYMKRNTELKCVNNKDASTTSRDVFRIPSNINDEVF